MKQIEIRDSKYIRQVSLNRPDCHNAFNVEMIEELTQAFSQEKIPNSIRVVQLSGEGKSFCAGADLNWMKSMVGFSVAENKTDSLKLFDMFATIRTCHLPVIGRVHGNVFGGGVGLTAVCDIVAADGGAQFCFSEAKLGLVPAVISPFVMQKIPQAWAREWMLTARVFTATQALNANLVQFVGTAPQIEEYVNDCTSRIVANGPEAIGATKKLIAQLSHMSWQECRDVTTRVIAERRVSPEGQEGLKSFLEKRSPHWKITSE